MKPFQCKTPPNPSLSAKGPFSNLYKQGLGLKATFTAPNTLKPQNPKPQNPKTLNLRTLRP